jgi:predicted nucleic acid-binding protein
LQLLISDSNIFIDMEVSKLTQKMFELPYQFAVPDILYYEELEEEHDNLLEYGLVLKTLTSESINYVDNTLHQYPKIGFYDKLALATAKQEACPLVTGDGALREAGKNEAVIIFGTIWLIDELITHLIITLDEAREAYSLMRDNGRRLPWRIIEERLGK